MRKPAKIAVLVLCSLMFGVLLLECGIRRDVVFVPRYPESSGWWKEHWQRTPKDPNGHLVTLDEHHPQLGHVLKSNLDGVRDCKRGTVHSNSTGLRGTREYAYHKAPGTVRVLTIGDSFTFGSCVRDEETFSARLEQRGRCEVINMGVQGYGTDQIYLRYLLEGRKYNADHVVLGFFSDDASRNKLSFRTYRKPRYVARGEGLKLIDDSIEHPRDYRDRPRLRLLNYLEIFHDWIRAGAQDRRNDLVTIRLHDALIDAIKGQGARPVFVYLPDFKTVMYNAAPVALFRRLCARRSDVTCVNPIPRIRKLIIDKPGPYSHFEHHYSPQVHRLIADALAEHIPCS